MENKIEFTRDFYMNYVQTENENNHYHASPEVMSKVVDLIEYLGPESYRPVTRLLLGNWDEISKRVDQFTPAQWQVAEDIVNAEGDGKLDKRYVAMLIEVLEGEDTKGQSLFDH